MTFTQTDSKQNSLIRAAAVAAALSFITGCSGGDNATALNENAAALSNNATVLADGSEFIVRVITQGSDAAIETGQIATVHYTGWLHDPEAADGRGTKFDSSVDRDIPFQFPLGAGRVIRGWDAGVEGMRIGEKRELIIPALWAYGEGGAGDIIPGGATLLFEVELLGID